MWLGTVTEDAALGLVDWLGTLFMKVCSLISDEKG